MGEYSSSRSGTEISPTDGYQLPRAIDPGPAFGELAATHLLLSVGLRSQPVEDRLPGSAPDAPLKGHGFCVARLECQGGFNGLARGVPISPPEQDTGTQDVGRHV